MKKFNLLLISVILFNISSCDKSNIDQQQSSIASDISYSELKESTDISSDNSYSESEFSSSESLEDSSTFIDESSDISSESEIIFGEDGWDEDLLNYKISDIKLKQMPNFCEDIDFTNINENEKINIISKMEEFSYSNHLAGIPITKEENGIINYLFVNSFDKDYALKEFGENYDTDYRLIPALKNNDFLKGISLSVDRLLFATDFGGTPCLDIYSDSLKINNIQYNNTLDHKENLLKYYDNNQNIIDNYGFDIDKAQEYFKKACEYFLTNNIYKENDTIKFNITFNPSEHNIEGLYDKSIEDAFNDLKVCGGKLKLDISYVYPVFSYATDIMSHGSFNMYFHNFSDTKYDFFVSRYNKKLFKLYDDDFYPLNFGIDTYSLNNAIEYNNRKYPYDVLVSALDKPTFINENSEIVNLCDFAIETDFYNNKTNGRDIVIKYVTTNIKDVCEVKVKNVMVTGQLRNDSNEFAQSNIKYEDNGVDTINISISEEFKEIFEYPYINVIFSIRFANGNEYEYTLNEITYWKL